MIELFAQSTQWKKCSSCHGISLCLTWELSGDAHQRLFIYSRDKISILGMSRDFFIDEPVLTVCLSWAGDMMFFGSLQEKENGGTKQGGTTWFLPPTLSLRTSLAISWIHLTTRFIRQSWALLRFFSWHRQDRITPSRLCFHLKSSLILNYLHCQTKRETATFLSSHLVHIFRAYFIISWFIFISIILGCLCLLERGFVEGSWGDLV